MAIWILIMIVVLAAMLAGLVYLSSRFARFEFIQRRTAGKKWRARGLGLLPVILIMVISGYFLNMINAIVIILHLLMIWMCCELIMWLMQKLTGNRFSRYYAGMMAIPITVVWLCVGAYLDCNVWEKDYNLKTDKEVGQLRVAMIADSHVGATFHADGFARHLEKLQEAKPDLFLIAGDFVDDDTTKEDMVKSCEALGKVKTSFGSYFAFGNHDKGYYNGRDYSGDDLIAELEKNGVTVLQDDVLCIDNRFYLIGRQDASENMHGDARRSIQSLLQDTDRSKYSIVINHQPTDYENEEPAEVDLVLSGHTHGGQLFPFNMVGEWTGVNDKVYGHEKRGKTDFIVTSGISNWALVFKTGCRSEYVIIDIEGK